MRRIALLILIFLAALGCPSYVSCAGPDQPWPPDKAMFDRLQASASFEQALKYVKSLASSVPGHAFETGFQTEASALGHMAAAAATATGDHLGLIEEFAPMLEESSRLTKAVGHLATGAVYASGKKEFPTWHDAAAQHLKAAVYLAPFTHIASAARAIGAEYGIGIPCVPWYVLLGCLLAVVVIAVPAVVTLRKPRLKGCLTIRGSGATGLASPEIVHLEQAAGRGKYITARLDGGAVKIERDRGSMDAFLRRRAAGTSQGEDGFIVALFPGRRRSFHAWAPAGGQKITEGYPVPFYPSILLDGDCELRIAGLIVRIEGTGHLSS